MAQYESEITQFLRDLKAQHPQIEQSQREGRALWWDKAPVPLERQAELKAAKIPQAPYVYATKE